MSDEIWADRPGGTIAGTTRLAEAALGTPRPAPRAETESRRRIVALMEQSALSPRSLRELPAVLPGPDSWRARLRRFWKRSQTKR